MRPDVPLRGSDEDSRTETRTNWMYFARTRCVIFRIDS